jgi:hypothetical protein
MKADPTTIAGMTAGAALAVASLPGLPKPVTFLAGLTGAAAIGTLGWHAKSCPPNCPGTDPRGNLKNHTPPRPRIIIPVACGLVLLAALALALLTGCSFTRASTTRTVNATNGLPVERASVTGWTFFDSGQTLAKASAHSGYATNGTFAPGVNMAGVQQSSSSTGLVLIIQNLIPAAVPALPK